jgi:Outer membrane protein beta-barrel domain
MYKPDEDIDRLSREAAEHYHAPGQPSWDALSQTLDKELPPEKEKKRRGFLLFFLLGIGLFLAGSAIWYGARLNKNVTSADKLAEKKQDQVKASTFTTVDNHTIAKDNKKDNKTTQSVEAAPTTIESSDTRKIIPATSNDNNNTKAVSNKPTADKKELNSPKVIPGNHSSVTASAVKHVITAKSTGIKSMPLATVPVTSAGIHHAAKNNTSVQKELTVANNNKPRLTGTALHKNQQRDQSVIAGVTGTAGKTNKGNKYASGQTSVEKVKSAAVKGADAGRDIATNNTDTDNTKDNTVTNSNGSQTVTAADPDTISNKTAAVKDVAVIKPDTTKENKDAAKTTPAKVKSKQKNDKAILLGLTAGMDISTVKFTYGSNAGYNIGFMGGYQFSKHWSVYTGVVYTKKNYKLNGKDYHPAHPYWTLYVNLEDVEGYCKMWEVPLQARYTFNPGTKATFFANAGLSSYFMTRQFYNYSWKNSMNQPMTGSWGTDSTFKHVFSILDISVGLEKSIGKHMNLQIEPYAKIPFGGVGFGNIRLSSFGVNLTVQYRQPIKR